MKHRKTSTFKIPQPRQVGATLAALAVLALGGFIREQLPKAADVMAEPLTYTDSAPRYGDVSSPEAILATEVNGVSTHGYWLLVRTQYTPSVPDEMYAGFLDAADGRRFEASNNYRQACGYLHTGIPAECILAFEVPADALPGAALQVGPPRESLAPRITVPLDLGADRVKEMEAAAGPYKNEKVRV